MQKNLTVARQKRACGEFQMPRAMNYYGRLKMQTII